MCVVVWSLLNFVSLYDGDIISKHFTTRLQIDIEANTLLILGKYSYYLKLEPPMPVDLFLFRNGVEWVRFYEFFERHICICVYESGHLILVNVIEPGPHVAQI